jgi:hypothetical protein
VIVSRQTLNDRFVRDLEREILGLGATIEHPEVGEPKVHFGSDFDIAIGCQWRLRDDVRIFVTNTDDGHWFGLAAPVDAAAKANEALDGKILNSIEFSSTTGDLIFHFSERLTLEILTTSFGYESWVMFLRNEHFAVGGSGGLI